MPQYFVADSWDVLTSIKSQLSDQLDLFQGWGDAYRGCIENLTSNKFYAITQDTLVLAFGLDISRTLETSWELTLK